MKNEIVIYQDEHSALHIEAIVNDQTLWLTQAQIVMLFESSKSNISEHIKHVFESGELLENSVVRKFRTTASDGKRYNVKHYSLDVVISVGYRVNSIRGTQFRIWANKILQDYLLKGYVLNNRVNRIEEKVNSLSDKISEIDLKINTDLPPKQGIFFDGQVFDAYTFVCDIVRSATKSIVVIDNYVDETTLTLLSKRKRSVNATIYTKPNKVFKLDLAKHNQQYPEIAVKKLIKSHDRFIIIDRNIIYHLGASLKDLGKKWFAFSRIDLDAEEILKKLNSD